MRRRTVLHYLHETNGAYVSPNILDRVTETLVYNGTGTLVAKTVVGYDQLAVVHRGEPILDPANSPDRNRGILAEAGVLDLLNQPSVTNVYIGNQQLDAYIDYRIQQNNRATASALRSGSRR